MSIMDIMEKMNNYNVTEDLLEIFKAQLSFWMLVILMFSGTTFVPTKEQTEQIEKINLRK